MTFPTFASGDVLNASDMNAVSSWLIKTATLSTATTDVTSCFTDDYNVYLVTLDTVSLSGAGNVYVQMLSSTTPNTTANYHWAYRGLKAAAGASGDSNGGTQTQAFTGLGASVDVANLQLHTAQMFIFSPKLAQRTLAICHSACYDSDFTARNGMWAHNVTTAYDGLRFTTTTTVTMTGTVRVYGWKKS